MSAVSVSAMVAGRQLTLEVGRLGPLTDGVVFARYGDTSLLVSAVSEWDLAPSSDFIPFQVDYREKAFAGGMIPNTYTRREVAASDRETLAARVIDRSCRPLFPAGYAYDTQVVCSVLSYDKDCDPSMLSITAASAALTVSNIPWLGPVAAVRVGWLDGAPVLAPTYAQDAASKLNLLYSGTEDKAMMLEIGASELPEAAVVQAMRFAQDELQPLLGLQAQLRQLAGKEKRVMPVAVPPPEVMAAVKELIWEDARDMYRQHHYKKAQRGNAQRLLFLKIRTELAPQFPPDMHRYFSAAGDKVMKEALRSLVHEAAAGSALTHVHPLRGPATPTPTPHLPVGDAAATAEGSTTPLAADATSSPLQQVADALLASSTPAAAQASSMALGDTTMTDDDADNVIELELRSAPGGRPDGRSSTDIRPLRCEVDVLPRVHGSAIFARGDTEVLCTTTLGPLDLAQLLRPMGGDVVKKNFFLHYDFPPYCTNEVGKVGGANRRMVGHGALAERALLAVMPDEAEFPYTIRATSEVSGSDGSSSMATVCGTCLSLMDAGVPIRTPVAGISIGVFTPPDTQFRADGPRRDYVLLTDIFGLEDHSGDMDFKIAGSRYGVTAAQLDVKPAGLPLEVLEQALWRARDARLRVLDAMATAMARPRSEMKDTAPRIEQMMVPPELMGRLIGPGGANVKRIMSATGARVQIDRDGDNPLVSVYADPEALAAARDMIHSTLDEHRRLTGSPLSYISSPQAPVLTVGTKVQMRVLRVHEYGVVLGTEQHECGWMHISEFSPKRTTKVTDVLDEGDDVTALVVDVDSRGRAKFSMRMLLPPGELDPTPFIKRNARIMPPAQPAPDAAATVPTATPPVNAAAPAPVAAVEVDDGLAWSVTQWLQAQRRSGAMSGAEEAAITSGAQQAGASSGLYAYLLPAIRQYAADFRGGRAGVLRRIAAATTRTTA